MTVLLLTCIRMNELTRWGARSTAVFVYLEFVYNPLRDTPRYYNRDTNLFTGEFRHSFHYKLPRDVAFLFLQFDQYLTYASVVPKVCYTRALNITRCLEINQEFDLLKEDERGDVSPRLCDKLLQPRLLLALLGASCRDPPHAFVLGNKRWFND